MIRELLRLLSNWMIEFYFELIDKEVSRASVFPTQCQLPDGYQKVSVCSICVFSGYV